MNRAMLASATLLGFSISALWATWPVFNGLTMVGLVGLIFGIGVAIKEAKCG